MPETIRGKVPQLPPCGRANRHPYGSQRVPDCSTSVLPWAIAGGFCQCREQSLCLVSALPDAAVFSGNMETTDISHPTDGNVWKSGRRTIWVLGYVLHWPRRLAWACRYLLFMQSVRLSTYVCSFMLSIASSWIGIHPLSKHYLTHSFSPHKTLSLCYSLRKRRILLATFPLHWKCFSWWLIWVSAIYPRVKPRHPST